MNAPITRRLIKQLCGQASFERGEAYFLGGKVSFLTEDPSSGSYSAVVWGKQDYSVNLEIDDNGDVEADCDCPAYYTYDNYCKHIAAVLFAINQLEDEDGLLPQAAAPLLDIPDGQLTPRYTPPGTEERLLAATTGLSPSDTRLMNGVLDLFADKPRLSTASRQRFEDRSTLSVEFVLKPYIYSYKKYMFGVELRVGPKRLYIVPRIRDFLEAIERRLPLFFSKNFSYDPSLHSFLPRDEAVLRRLTDIHHQERLYQETTGSSLYNSRSAGGERMLLLPSYAWDGLLPLLGEATAASVELPKTTIRGIRPSAEPLPLRFEFAESSSQGYRMEVQGLHELILMEAYGLAVAGDRLIRISPDQCRRLIELRGLLEVNRKEQVQILPEQMAPFMENVVPRLLQLGQVHIAEAISEKVVQLQLKARLYLDRVRNRLLAGLEFQYGDIVVNPLETGGASRGTEQILVRDGAQERQILDLMEQGSFTSTESGYYLENEEEEYDFLYHILPQLEERLEVYATSAVKTRLHSGPPPKVKVDVDERTDWLEFRFDMDGIPEADIRNLLKSLVEKRPYHKLSTGALLPLQSSEFQAIAEVINELGMSRGDWQGNELRIPAMRGLRLLDSEARRAGHSVKLGKGLRELLENIANPDNLEFTLPDSLAPVLRDYQKYGFQWLKTLAHYRFGGILADDMGLGKTLQSIAYIVSSLADIRSLRKPVLIICPASLIYNWRNELQRFAPEVKAAIADGTKNERGGAVRTAMEEADVLITSYPLLRRDLELYVGHSFHTLILDEAQAFKNHATQTAQAVKELAADYRFALTGTPVENRLEELWSIYDAVFPELFPSRKGFNELPREAVAKRVRPFLLRRLKRDVLTELPEKIESVQACELLPEQKKLYVAYLAQLQAETVKHLHQDTFQQNRIKILAGLTRLRQLCCHPALFVEGYQGSSAKFEQLLELVEECRSSGKRMLIFSQFTGMLGLISRELGYQGVPFFYLDGSTPAAERVELCSRFNAGQRDLFLISLKAGGTGLNLTGADTVILYDLWWNPAVEEQAADRAHRIGQKNVVQVIRLVSQGTVEDKMVELQQRKKSLIDDVIHPGQEGLSALTEEDIRELLMIT